MDKKTEVEGFYKAPNGALINKDNEALRAYKIKKQREGKLDMLESEISGLKSDMQEIKELLRGLVK
jgi:hypothetical protein